MKMAKASKADIQRVHDFMQFIDEFMEYGAITGDSDEEITLDDDAFVARLRDMWGHRFGPCKVDASWRRVVFGCDILIDNCCDPNSDTLEWRPDIAMFLATAEPTTTNKENDK